MNVYSQERSQTVGKREDIVEEVDKDRRGIVEEVVDKRRRKQQQQNRLTAAAAGDRSTGAVDRRAQHAQRHERSTARSTAEELGRPPVDRLK